MSGLYGKDLRFILTLITNEVAFAASVDQDQAAQNVQSVLGSTLSALGKLCRQNQPRKCNYFGHISRIEMCDMFIWLFKG